MGVGGRSGSPEQMKGVADPGRVEFLPLILVPMKGKSESAP